jgi:multicomponent Na+:H+ antiporter subunit F
MTGTDIALVLVAVGVLFALVRIWRGPSAADRAVAAELVFIATVGAIVIVSDRLNQPVLLDVALVAVLGGFVATISLARLVHRDDERP